MFIHVFMGDVGQYRHVEFTGIDAILCPTVRRGLQHYMCQPGLDHLRQVTLHIMCIGCSDMEAGIQHLVADHGIDSRDHPGLEAGCQQDLMKQVGRGGLAIGTSDANHCQLAGRPIVKCSSQPRKSAAGIFESQIWDGKSAELLIPHHRGGAVRNGLVDVTVTILGAALHGNEEVAGPDDAAIDGNATDRHIGNVRGTR